MGAALQAAQRIGVDSPEYKALAQRFSDMHSGGTNVELVRLDPLVLQGKHREAVAVLDRLGRRVGGDPYLDTMRATMWLEAGDAGQAAAAADRGIKALPGMADTHWASLEVGLQTDDFDRMLDAMIALHDRFGVEFVDDLARQPGYTNFAQSPQHARWRAHLTQQQTGQQP